MQVQDDPQQRRVTILVQSDDHTAEPSLCDWVSVRFPRACTLCVPAGVDVVRAVGQQPVDLLLLDISRLEEETLEMILRIKKVRPQTTVIVVVSTDTSGFRQDSLAAGAFASVLRECIHVELFLALVTVLPSAYGQARVSVESESHVYR